MKYEQGDEELAEFIYLISSYRDDIYLIYLYITHISIYSRKNSGEKIYICV